MATMNATLALRDPAFETALQRFKIGLTDADIDNFQFTSLQELKTTICDLQAKQASTRTAKNMARLKVFLEGMEQYGKVIEVFLNASGYVAFIWVASNLADAFNALLDAYQRIGEQIPLLLQYQALFQAYPHMRQLLVDIYQDILEFHREAIKHFQKSIWKLLFAATWKNFKGKFSGILENLGQHKRLIENQASLISYEEIRSIRINAEAQAIQRRQADLEWRQITVRNWLGTSNHMHEQEKGAAIRAEFPTSGDWLLQQEQFKAWFDRDYCSAPLLWLNGKPGAGKTVLASLVVEKATSLSGVAQAFFYCKHGDARSNTFIALARNMLSQLLHQHPDLLPHYYEKAFSSSGAVLTSLSLAKEMLEIGLKFAAKTYVIIDGLDECGREERKEITRWFRNLIEELLSTQPDHIRCLFISQDDGPARKDFSVLPSLKIHATDIEGDIEQYASKRGLELQRKFELPDLLRIDMIRKVTEGSQGMFLFAKLSCDNLCAQTSQNSVERELDTRTFPKEVDEAYERILHRVFDQASDPERADMQMLLSWLVCAKRTLYWHEIQCAKSVDIDESTVNLTRHKFRVSAKDLCGSLVEIQPEGSIEFVHLTAKLYLQRSSWVVKVKAELQMGLLCLRYLSFPGFDLDAEEPDLVRFIREGYYGFLDYAIVNWVHHFADSGIADTEAPAVEEVAECLESFLDIHFTPGAKSPIPTQSITRILEPFRTHQVYDRLEAAFIATRAQVTSYTSAAADNLAVDLSKVLLRLREKLENLEPHGQDLSELYGSKLFKCPRLSCDYFVDGFATAKDRERHLAKHERAFQCDVENCSHPVSGYPTQKDLDKHKADFHQLYPDKEHDFPVTSAPKKAMARFSCSLCPRRFTRAYNLRAHLRTHTDERPHVCSVCGKNFAVLAVKNRHEALHSGEKNFVCRGSKDGRDWGCGRRFARADSLRKHFHNGAGRVCIKPLLKEEALEKMNLGLSVGGSLAGQQPSLSVPSSFLPGAGERPYQLPMALLQQYPNLGEEWNMMPSDLSDSGVSGQSTPLNSSSGLWDINLEDDQLQLS